MKNKKKERLWCGTFGLAWVVCVDAMHSNGGMHRLAQMMHTEWCEAQDGPNHAW